MENDRKWMPDFHPTTEYCLQMLGLCIQLTTGLSPDYGSFHDWAVPPTTGLCPTTGLAVDYLAFHPRTGLLPKFFSFQIFITVKLENSGCNTPSVVTIAGAGFKSWHSAERSTLEAAENITDDLSLPRVLRIRIWIRIWIWTRNPDPNPKSDH